MGDIVAYVKYCGLNNREKVDVEIFNRIRTRTAVPFPIEYNYNFDKSIIYYLNKYYQEQI